MTMQIKRVAIVGGTHGNFGIALLQEFKDIWLGQKICEEALDYCLFSSLGTNIKFLQILQKELRSEAIFVDN